MGLALGEWITAFAKRKLAVIRIALRHRILGRQFRKTKSKPCWSTCPATENPAIQKWQSIPPLDNICNKEPTALLLSISCSFGFELRFCALVSVDWFAITFWFMGRDQHGPTRRWLCLALTRRMLLHWNHARTTSLFDFWWRFPSGVFGVGFEWAFGNRTFGHSSFARRPLETLLATFGMQFDLAGS